jgi:hypothetical protein
MGRRIVASRLYRARPGANACEHSKDQQGSNDYDGFNDARSVKSTARRTPWSAEVFARTFVTRKSVGRSLRSTGNSQNTSTKYVASPACMLDRMGAPR